MAGKEAIMRENHLKKNKLKKQIRIISIISAIAAFTAFAIYLPDFFHQSPSPETDRNIQFFTASTDINEVVFEVENKTPEVIKDSFMVINTPAKKKMQTRPILNIKL